MQRIIHLIEIHQTKEHMQIKSLTHQENMKDIFDKSTKERNFMIEYLILKWDVRKEARENHVKFDNLWLEDFYISRVQDNNTYELAHPDGEFFGDPINWRFLKHFL
jgi:hypothetical protein